MLNSFKRAKREEKESFKIPKGVQDAIPITHIFEDGIFRVGNNYSKTYKFTDINYRVASDDDTKALFMRYCDLINSIDTEAATKITINNRRLNKEDFEKRMLMPLIGDKLDIYRNEYNRMLLDRATVNSNNMVQEKYITVSAPRKNIGDARSLFGHVSADLYSRFAKLSSQLIDLDATDRLRIFHDFYRLGQEAYFNFDLQQTMRKGHDFKDSICPDSMEFNKDHIKIGDKYCRVLYMREFASFIKDDMITEFADLPRNLMLSIDLLPIPTDEAVKIINKLILGVETDKARFTRKQTDNNNFTANIPYELEQRSKELHEFMNDLISRDQRMIFTTVTIVLLSDSIEELSNSTESILSISRKHMCEFTTLTYQQVDGLYTVLPFGLHKLPFKWRTLTTESTAVLMPFKTQEIQEEGGVYYGMNFVSKNMIVADRRNLLNANGFIMGVSGSGKSFKAKEEISSLVLRDDVDIIILDPEEEYSNLVESMGGEIIRISAGSTNHINAMDMSKYYGGDENPIILKSEFILSLCEQLVGSLTAKEKSIIDRCTASVYREYVSSSFKGTPPTLKDFRQELLKQSEPEAREVALAIELYADGSLDTFARQTNVNVNSQFLVYDIKNLGKQLRTIGMLVVLDNIFNRITENRQKKRNTFIYIDEIYLLFQNEYSSNFLFELWKRVRKYGACCTGITQNVSDLLESNNAKTMLANSEFLVLLNQAATDRFELAKLLNISETQLSHITDNGVEGQGLLKFGGAIVPFENPFPKNTKMYKLMTTKLGE